MELYDFLLDKEGISELRDFLRKRKPEDIVFIGLSPGWQNLPDMMYVIVRGEDNRERKEGQSSISSMRKWRSLDGNMLRI